MVGMAYDSSNLESRLPEKYISKTATGFELLTDVTKAKPAETLTLQAYQVLRFTVPQEIYSYVTGTKYDANRQFANADAPHFSIVLANNALSSTLPSTMMEGVCMNRSLYNPLSLIRQPSIRPENRVVLLPVVYDANNLLSNPTYYSTDTAVPYRNNKCVPITTVLDHTNDPITRVRNNSELLELSQYNLEYLKAYFPNNNQFSVLPHWVEVKTSLTAIKVGVSDRLSCPD
jgi:hypothetical protein